MDGDQSNGSALGFFGFWMILVVGNMILLSTSRNAALKRLVLILGTVVTALLFLSFIGQYKPWIALMLLPVLALVAAFNAVKIRFCDACGMTNILADPFEPDPLCSDCGKPLNEKRRWF